MFKNISQYVLYSLLCVSLISCSDGKNDITQQSNIIVQNENNINSDQFVDKKAEIVTTNNNVLAQDMTKANSDKTEFFNFRLGTSF